MELSEIEQKIINYIVIHNHINIENIRLVTEFGKKLYSIMVDYIQKHNIIDETGFGLHLAEIDFEGRSIFHDACSMLPISDVTFNNYVKRLNEKHVEEGIIINAKKLASGSIDYKEAVNNTNELLTLLASEENIRNVKDICHDFVMKKLFKKSNYIESGFFKYDEVNGGFQNGDLIIIGARPSTGKTAKIVNMMFHNYDKHKMLFFSAEMSTPRVFARLLSRGAKLKTSDIMRGNYTSQQENILGDILSKLYDSNNIIIDDTCNIDIDDLYNIAKQKKKTDNIEIVFIDYMQLLSSRKKFFSFHQQIGYYCKRLKQLAKELNIPVVCLAQLNRGAEDGLPKKSDLKDSGDIEQAADVIILLHWLDDQSQCSIAIKEKISACNEDERIVMNIVDKNRDSEQMVYFTKYEMANNYMKSI